MGVQWPIGGEGMCGQAMIVRGTYHVHVTTALGPRVEQPHELLTDVRQLGCKYIRHVGSALLD